ncbi:sphingomyelin phosphodiesterase [Diachasma alloeum]|uniref:sphingomyelin phosphodiesterase n=1 Tax=Diachasma alloeum TaxID=454923 RepID=UPI0007384454|nr:sphingomyelin phosphodiesterase [Diachasma alloeum]XP_015127516.1 sphingomyelin phosphodiesterase [Diachasma alloeum]XP_015127517.1 sphingomyelin phosphodiesterase [Diachasma alloeum]
MIDYRWSFVVSILSLVIIPRNTSASVLRDFTDRNDWLQLNNTKDRDGISQRSVETDVYGFLDPASAPLHRFKRTIMDLGLSCFFCEIGVNLLQTQIRAGLSDEELMGHIKPVCMLQLSESVCEGVNQVFAPEVIYILRQVDITRSQICSLIMGDQCRYVANPLQEWRVSLPHVEKPLVQPILSPKEGVKTLKVLHISDTHYDPYYQEGANAECGDPLCCRLTSGRPVRPSGAAGKWGDYRKCDTPKRTLDHMFQHIQHTHPDIDYIIWTGDLPPHDSWNQTREENLQNLRDTVGQMLEAFPHASIFPALGNHESAPVNSFPSPSAPDNYSISWLYDELAEQWQRWLPSSASTTIKQGGFYSVPVRPGFRIISVNTNYCNNLNFWLLINSKDPVNELQWLIDELQGAENRSEKVHIIGHIPPGTSDCLKVWSANYYRIINRYESTITAQFFGHTHYDEFELFYDTDDLTRPVSVAYVGPSVTPYENLNPGYRIYYVDDDQGSSTRQVVDHETWIMNLEEANLYDSPFWWRLYSARDAYQMASLLPAEWNRLVDRMIDDTEIFDVYYKHYHKNASVRPLCDIQCRKRLLCDLRNGRSRDRKAFCRSIEERIDKQRYFNWGNLFFSG